MALYTILLGLSIFLIALVLAIIRKMFWHWKEEHKSERMVVTTTDRPAVSVIIYTDNCVIRRRRYSGAQQVYDVISKSDVSLTHAKRGSLQSRDDARDNARDDARDVDDGDKISARDDRKDQEKVVTNVRDDNDENSARDGQKNQEKAATKTD